MIKPTYYRSFKRILFEYLFEWYLKKEATKDGNFVIFTLLINSVWCVSYPSGYVSRTIMIRLTACNSSTRKHGWSNLHSKCLIWMEITMLLYQKKWLQSQKKWSWKMVADLFISCYIPIAYVYIYIPKQLELLSWILPITGIFQAAWLPLTWYLYEKIWWQLLWRP